jgi:phage baseplate assembly protein W
MAQIIQNKYPIDLDARKAVGFGFPLDGDAVFIPTYQTRDQIKANLVNYILTNRGERVFNPNFGANLRALLFEGIDDSTLDEIQNRIQNSISTYFPQIIINQIKFNTQPDQNTINFTLTYQIINFGITDSVNILLQ